MEETSTLALLVRMVVALAVVVGVMALAARLLRGRALAPGGSGRTAPIEVVARRGLGRNTSVALVRAGGRTVLIGVGESSVTLLAETEDNVLNEGVDGPGADWTVHPGGARRSGTTWKTFIESLRDRTVRRS